MSSEVPLEAHGGWPGLIGALLARQHLTSVQARDAMATILRGDATAAQLVGLVVALRAKEVRVILKFQLLGAITSTLGISARRARRASIMVRLGST